MARDVFISHATDDRAVAAQVCDLLEQRGLGCWIAPRNVSAGVLWDEAILDAIEGSRVFLLILSAHANESSFVKNEVNRAFSEGKPIIAFRVEDVQPRALAPALSGAASLDGRLSAAARAARRPARRCDCQPAQPAG